MFDHAQQGSVHVLASELPLNHENVAAATQVTMPHVQCGQPRVVLNL